jgi:hypothetical protein
VRRRRKEFLTQGNEENEEEFIRQKNGWQKFRHEFHELTRMSPSPSLSPDLAGRAKWGEGVLPEKPDTSLKQGVNERTNISIRRRQ